MFLTEKMYFHVYDIIYPAMFGTNIKEMVWLKRKHNLNMRINFLFIADFLSSSW